MALKVILFLISLLFLFGGGLCSIFLTGQNPLWILIAIGMVGLCLWSFVEACRWLAVKNTDERKSPAKLILITAAIVIVVYIACWNGAIDMRFAG